MKPEKTKLGKLEMQLLAYSQLRETDLLTSGQAAAALEMTPEQEWKLLKMKMALTRRCYFGRREQNSMNNTRHASTDLGPECAPRWVTYAGAWR